MIKYSGKGVYSAAAIGKIQVFRRKNIQVQRITADDSEEQIQRFEKARQSAAGQLEEIYRKALAEVGEKDAEIFEIHRMMLEDDDYIDAVKEKIITEKVNAEYAVSAAAEKFAQDFAAMDDAYMQARAADVRDISARVIACLSGNGNGGGAEGNPFADKQGGVSDNSDKVIICADDLAPSETVTLDKDKVLAFATAHGSSNSHTAILARSMNIPAIIGLGDEFLSQIKDGDIAVADGKNGLLIVRPDEDTIALYEKQQREEMEKRAFLTSLKGKENVTLSGKKINIFANIGSIDNIDAAIVNDAGGIGLFRSEFVYLENTDYPSEEEQFSVYKRALERMENKQVIIRTLDIGADKQADYFKLEKEENPALGLRAIRLCLERPEMFRTQLRALYRASVYGKLGIMFPMITSTSELSEILALCDEVKSELAAQGAEISDNVQLGIMIETPAAAVISDRLAPMVDFFSVGTNDLIQYTLACDRQNPHIEHFCDPHHEAVMRLIKFAADNAHKHGKWIGICGELAADTTLTETFVEMGIDELSVSPSFVLEVRDTVRKIQ